MTPKNYFEGKIVSRTQPFGQKKPSLLKSVLMLISLNQMVF